MTYRPASGYNRDHKSSTKLTTATLPLGEMGERAARTLMKMIETRGEVESSMVDCQFVLGDSTRPLK